MHFQLKRFFYRRYHEDSDSARIRNALQAYLDAKRAFRLLYGRDPDMGTDDVDIIGELYLLGLMSKRYGAKND